MSLVGNTPARVPTGFWWKLRALDYLLILSALALVAAGIIAVHVAGEEDGRYYAINQIMALCAGLAVAVPLALVDYRFLRHHVRTIYFLSLALLLLVLAVGTVGGGAQSWLDVGPVTFQPSEFAKIMMVVVLAAYLSENSAGRMGVFFKTLGLLAVPAALVFIQPDLGTALVFGAIFVVMAYVGGANLYQLGGLAAAGGLFTFLAVRLGLLEDYQVARLTAFLDPEGATDVGYQVLQSKTAIGSGGITGKGLDATTLANLGFLPEDHTDFIFSNLAERVGFVGSMVLLVLFFVLLWRILRVATISRDRFGVLLAVGISTIFLFHVFVNIGMTLGIMPVTGIPLPFVSYGRNNLMVGVICLGILQSIAVRSRMEASKQPKL